MESIEIIARLVLENDTDENWSNNSSRVLLRGEPIISWISDAPKLKIGDGVKTFAELPYLSFGGGEEGNLEVIISGTGNGLANASYLDNVLTITKGNFLTQHQDISGKLDKNNDITAVESPSLLKISYDSKGLITGSSPVVKADIEGLGISTTDTTYLFSTGTTNGTFQYKASSDTDYTEVSIFGLKSAAYTESTNYATAAEGILATNAMPKAGGTFTGAPIWATEPTDNSHLANKKYVDDSILAKLSSVFTIKGTKPTVDDLPITGNSIGDVWHIAEDHSEYAWMIVDNNLSPSWENIGGVIDLSGYVLKTDLKPLKLNLGGNSFSYSPLTEGNFNFIAGNNVELELSATGLIIKANNTEVSNLADDAGKVVTGLSNNTTLSTTNTGDLLLTGFVASTTESGTIVATDTITKALNKIYNLANSKTSNTGTVTSITAGAGLTGGTVTSSGTISHNTKPTSGTELTNSSSNATNLEFLTNISTDSFGHIAEVFSKEISASDLGAITSINGSSGIVVTGTGSTKTISIDTQNTVFILNGGNASSWA